MSSVEMIRTFTEYHYTMTQLVWDSLAQISEKQFLADEAYSRGSIRNLMVHLANSDRCWLAGLKNQPDVGNVKFEDFPTRAAARALFEQVTKDVIEYVATLTEAKLGENPNNMPGPRWQALLHMVNHGTDHRAIVLERLHALGAPTFDQDFILWLWGKKSYQISETSPGLPATVRAASNGGTPVRDGRAGKTMEV